MKRVFLFVVTNVAILIVLGTVLSLLGINSVLAENQVDLDLWNLLAFSALFGMGGSFISLFLSKWMAKRMTGARVIEPGRGGVEDWLLQTVGHQAQAAGIRIPEVAVYDSPTPNAFATGARRDKAFVAVSTGLLQGMNRDEVEAVLGHEISHVANGDMVTLTLVQGVVNTFVIFLSRIVGYYVDRVIFKTERGVGPAFFVTSIVAQIAFGILASTIVFAFSRRREFRADAGGARLAGANKMIAALERLKSGAQEPLPKAMAAFGISGGKGKGFARLWMTHPPLDERIEALRSGSGS